MNTPVRSASDERVSNMVCSILGIAIDGWLLMLAIGVLHAERPIVPTFGYWQSTFLAWVIAGIVGTGLITVSQRVRRIGKYLAEKS